MAQPSLAAVANQPLETDHRRFLAPPPAEDSSTDIESDDPSHLRRIRTHVPDAEDVLGISISRAQTRMKSPETPAIEKARALNESASYFGPDLELVEEPSQESSLGIALPSQSSDENTVEAASSQTPSSVDAEDSPVTSPCTVHPPQQRFSFTRSVLGEATANRRQRSSSGPSMLGSLRKYLPDVPSMSFPKSTEPAAGDHDLKEVPDRQVGVTSNFPWSNRTPFIEPEDHLSPKDTSKLTRVQSPVSPSATGLDGNLESLLSPISPSSTRSRPRSNSETSLYLKRKPSGVSAFDDTSAFANVSDMANSRFKAITDSFQNSTLRLPKLPSIKNPAKRLSIHGGSSGSTDRLTRENTERNTGTMPRSIDYEYTSIKKIRNAKKLAADVESPQQRAHPILSDALSKTTGDVIVMGGYRGSILRSAKPPHRQCWAPVKVGLNLRTVDLEVGLTREHEEKMEETIYSSGVLSHIGPIDICRRLLRHLKKCPNQRENKLRVHDWGYDWRLSPDLLGQRLIDFLEKLECNHPETPPEKRGAIVIAHSLGGLITRHAVNRRPELFAGVLYAGVPQNCVNILGPLRNGDDVLLSSRVLTAQVNFTLRTSYALLPEDGRCFIQKHTNERYDLNFFDHKVWEEYRLSPCISGPLPQALKETEQRKSIMESLSETISSSFPLNPTKRSSWFGGRESSPARDMVSKTDSAKNAVKDTAKETVSGAEQAYESMNAPEGNTEHNLQPSMRQPIHKPSIATACTIPRDKAEEYLERTLKEVLAFKQSLSFIRDHQLNNRYPPHALIFGKTVPTVYGARVANREAIKYADAFDDLAFAAGDGVVLASAAQLPEGYRVVKNGRVETDRGHVGLLGDLEGVGKCLSAIVEARAKGVGLGRVKPRGQTN